MQDNLQDIIREKVLGQHIGNLSTNDKHNRYRNVGAILGVNSEGVYETVCEPLSLKSATNEKFGLQFRPLLGSLRALSPLLTF